MFYCAAIRKVHLRGAAGLQKVKGIKSNKIKKKNNNSRCRMIVTRKRPAILSLPMSHHQQCHHAALLGHEHVERATGGTRVHDLETDAGAQELSAEGCGREDLALPGSQQN